MLWLWTLLACSPDPLPEPELYEPSFDDRLELSDRAYPACPDGALEDAFARGTLRVGLPNDGTSYFLWRGRVLGFEYEVLEAFAKELGLDLEPVRIVSVRDRYEALQTGQVDAIAGRLADLQVEGVHYSPALLSQPAVLVQRATPLTDDTSTLLKVHSLEDLRGQRLTLVGNQGWGQELRDLEDDLSLQVLSDRHSAEFLVRGIEHGRFDVGVARADLAALAVGAGGNVVAWPTLEGANVGAHVAFREDATVIASWFDEWVDAQGPLLDTLYARYFADPELHRSRIADPSYTRFSNVVSPYDEIFRSYAEEIPYDWTLLASLAYQESRFKPEARSWAGARGLMQLMPRTANSLGVVDPYDPDQAVRGAADYLLWLDGYWERTVEDPDFRLNLVLASYNAGLGHVGDARRLAAALGGDPDDWNDVAQALLNLEHREFYRNKVVRYGYVRGTEPVAYVRDIRTRHRSYEALADLDPIEE